MLALPPSRRAGALLRLFTPVLALMLSLTLTACGDDEDDPLAPDNPIIGTWASVETGEYIRITRSEMQFFFDFGSCIARLDARIRAQDGDVYTIDLGGGLVGQLEIQAAGGELTIDNGDEVSVLEASSVDVDDFDICEDQPDGEFDPDLATCSSLPALELDGAVSGGLTTTDPIAGGYRYDMYRLQIATSQSVHIDMTSDQLDSYLYLYAASDTRLTEDDDGGDVPPDARITASLNAGCYIVVASSFGFAELGDYVLSVTTF